MTTLVKEYKRQRALGVQAKHAIHTARTLVEWEGLGGHTKQDDYEEPDARVRLSILPDEDWQHATECGCPDTGCEERNIELANRDGVWGIVGEYRIRDEDDWEQADSIWGFIGSSWEDSGYDTDVRGETIRALKAAIGAF